MLRVIIYSFVMAIFVVIINLLKYTNNFKNLTYESSFLETITYVVVSFMGCGHIGIYPISKIGKMIIILLSLFKYLILIEIVIKQSIPDKYLNIYKGVKDLVNIEKLNIKTD